MHYYTVPTTHTSGSKPHALSTQLARRRALRLSPRSSPACQVRREPRCVARSAPFPPRLEPPVRCAERPRLHSTRREVQPLARCCATGATSSRSFCPCAKVTAATMQTSQTKDEKTKADLWVARWQTDSWPDLSCWGGSGPGPANRAGNCAAGDEHTLPSSVSTLDLSPRTGRASCD